MSVDTENNAAKAAKHVVHPLHRIIEHVTTFVHVITVLFTFFILYLALLYPLNLYSWHPILFAFGWLLLMTEGVLMLSGDNIFSTFLTQKQRVLVHWLVQVAAVALSIAGFIVMFLNQEEKGRYHFDTTHGLLGLISFVLMCITFVLGIPAMFTVELRKIIPPKINKFLHIFLGFVTYLVGGVCLVYSLYTDWFRFQVNDTTFALSFAALVIIVVWTLIKPLLNVYQRSKKLC